MRALIALFILITCAATPAAALTLACPTQEFPIPFDEHAETLDAAAAEIIDIAVLLSQRCETATFVVVADGVSRNGPWHAQLVGDALEDRGIDEARLRTDLLSPESDRWNQSLSDGAVVVNVYFSRPAPEAASDPMGCFDVALVGRIIRYDYNIGHPNDGQIYMRWPWKLDVAVDQVLIGAEHRRNIEVWMSLHTQYRSEVNHILFFLRRSSNGTYSAVDSDITVVADRLGRFVVPLAAPIESYGLRPEGWAPSNYQDYMRPIHYRASNAWWLQLEEEARPAPGWSRLRRDYVVAERGIPLNTLPTMMASTVGAACEPE